ncbi:hypothetical protein BDV23DRAFT_187915 [Aspergillus alliaceus]|uniref:Uncharacterized protein n=1 Tax=Petromyces alliaceus TaxID=209559 RepID=A0A5N7BVW2_PETAA|nr:hypothetical protein BDV23DRAFT_187915 [Aspergillus alliaceus]
MRKVPASKTPRVIMVSNGVHRIGHIRWSDHSFNNDKHYQRWLAYGQSWITNTLMSLAFTEKPSCRGLLAFPMCPGVCYTNLAAHGIDGQASSAADLTQMDNVYGNKWLWGMDELFITAFDQGAATHVFAAFGASIAEHNGAFLSDCHVADPDQEEVSSWATSKADTEKLWKLSEKLVGQGFEY